MQASAVTLAGSLCRPAERVILGYFVYSAALATYWYRMHPRTLEAWLIPCVLYALFVWEGRVSNRWTAVLRHWLPLSMVLVAYYQVDLFPAPPLVQFQQLLIPLDQFVLLDLGVKRGIEAFGPAIPWVLEMVYLGLYVLPPAAMALIYLNRKTREGDRFLFTFFCCAFSAYALLPHFPTLAPRVAFPEVAPPAFTSVWRVINLYNLNNLDIATSVFPSGHVAIAFACAYALWTVLPERKWLVRVFFALAAAVYAATFYCRYHYVADGAMSIVVTTAACWISQQYVRKTELQD